MSYKVDAMTLHTKCPAENGLSGMIESENYKIEIKSGQAVLGSIHSITDASHQNHSHHIILVLSSPTNDCVA